MPKLLYSSDRPSTWFASIMLEKPPLKCECDIHQADHHRHLNQGTDNCSESHTRPDSKYGYSYRDRQLEVIARRSECQSCGLAVISPDRSAHEKANQEHKYEVDQERDGYSYDVAGYGNDQFALQTEHHHDGKEQCSQGQRTDLGNELFVIPFFAFCSNQERTMDNGRPLTSVSKASANATAI